jgi:Cu2+-exporting ATPase
MKSPVPCQHCGTPFQPTAAEPDFCCAGCSFVYGMIVAGGMEKFYDLKGGATLLPVGGTVLLPPDTDWARLAQTEAETQAETQAQPAAPLTNSTRHRSGTGNQPATMIEAAFDIQGVSCIGCVWLIEAAFARETGGIRCIVDPSRGLITLQWCRGAFDLSGFVRNLASFGYRITACQDGRQLSADNGNVSGSTVSNGVSDMKLGLCGGMALNAMAFTLPRYTGMDPTSELAGIFEIIAAFSATVSLFAGGGYFIPRAWAALRLRRLHLDVPIALGIVAAWLGSVAGWLLRAPGLLYFDFVAVFIFLMLVGRRLQEASVTANRQRLLRQDPSLQPVEVPAADVSALNPDNFSHSENWRPLPVRNLTAGQKFRVLPGAVVPVAARLETPRALLSLDWISGEAEPVPYSAGAIIPSGAIHLGSQPLPLTASEPWGDSLLSRLTRDDSAKCQDNAATRWLDRTLRVYLGIILLTALTGFIWWLAKGTGWTAATQVLVSVLVVSCPCALGVAVPLAHDLAVARLRTAGVFVRSPDLWRRLMRVGKIVFDKTGTLTLDTPRLRDPEALNHLPANAAAALATLVSESRHPVSAALREALALQDLFHPDIVRTKTGEHSASSRPEEICGHGIRLTTDDGTVWELRRPSDNISTVSPHASEKINPGVTLEAQSEAVLTRNGQPVAGFQFSETGRSDAAPVINEFHREGKSVFLLSGDREAKVHAMAAALGIPESHALARRSPEEKGQWMSDHGHDALFIGDGANDTLAAQAACCSGTLAVDRTLLAESSDFYFLSRSLSPLRLLFQTARQRQTAVRRAFLLAVIYNIGALLLALTGHMNPLLAAILMPLSSVATILTVTLSLRQRRKSAAAGLGLRVTRHRFPERDLSRAGPSCA